MAWFFSWPVLEASSRGQFVKLLFLRASASVISRAWLALTPDKASSSLRHGISKLWTIQFQMALEFKKETPGAEFCNESSHAILLIDVRRVLNFNARTDCLVYNLHILINDCPSNYDLLKSVSCPLGMFQLQPWSAELFLKLP